TRVDRIRRFFASVQRPPATLSPARCTTASAPASADGSSAPDAGSQRARRCPATDAAPAPRTTRTTRWPADVRPVTSAEPTSPLAGRLAVEWRAACGFRASWVCCMGGCPPSIPARVAKLADAPDLGSGGCKPLGVRLPPLAPTWSVDERGASVKVEVEAIEG